MKIDYNISILCDHLNNMIYKLTGCSFICVLVFGIGSVIDKYNIESWNKTTCTFEQEENTNYPCNRVSCPEDNLCETANVCETGTTSNYYKGYIATPYCPDININLKPEETQLSNSDQRSCCMPYWEWDSLYCQERHYTSILCFNILETCYKKIQKWTVVSTSEEIIEKTNEFECNRNKFCLDNIETHESGIFDCWERNNTEEVILIEPHYSLLLWILSIISFNVFLITSIKSCYERWPEKTNKVEETRIPHNASPEQINAKIKELEKVRDTKPGGKTYDKAKANFNTVSQAYYT